MLPTKNTNKYAQFLKDRSYHNINNNMNANNNIKLVNNNDIGRIGVNQNNQNNYRIDINKLQALGYGTTNNQGIPQTNITTNKQRI